MMTGRQRSLWNDLTMTASNAREHGLSTTRARALLRRDSPPERAMMREIKRLRARVSNKHPKRGVLGSALPSAIAASMHEGWVAKLVAKGPEPLTAVLRACVARGMPRKHVMAAIRRLVAHGILARRGGRLMLSSAASATKAPKAKKTAPKRARRTSRLRTLRARTLSLSKLRR